ncbi:MAG TPA: glycoside hydrolase family 2 TIM barrel-domain containing protein [Opitutaceae bacterium]|jgi:beta-glucuronidase
MHHSIRRAAVVLFVLAAACVRAGEAPPTLIDRPAISLDGDWRTIVDPYDSGYFNYREKPYDQTPNPSPSAYFMDAKPGSPGDLVEYDFDRSRILRVPGDWNTQQRDLYYYEGTVWYRRLVSAPADAAGHRLFLRFGAANYHADVYLNGKKLGYHDGGFTPFAFEVTGRLKSEKNSLVVRVENRRQPDRIPAMATDWWNYGGLTRDVTLVSVPTAFVAAHHLHLESEETGIIAGEVELDGAAAGTSVEVAIPELNLTQTATADATGHAKFQFPAPGLKLWIPENPKLYEVHFRSGTDDVADAIGFRTIRTRGKELLLNGRPIFLRGVCMHDEDAFGGGGRVVSVAQSLQLLSWAKELGCNYLRLAHYPHNETTIRLADRLGIMLWSEVPVYWAIDWKSEASFDSAAAQLTAMIRRDNERASVIIWSLANETPVSPERTRFIGRLASLARSLDGSRLLAAAMERRADPHDPNRQIVQDPIAAFLDVASFNEYLGWYEGTIEQCDHVQWYIPYDKPVLISEFGGDGVAGLHGSPAARWTEEYQADLYRHSLAMLDRIPGLQGMTPWVLLDFRSPRRVLPGIEDDFNRKGLVSSNGVKKAAFFVLQKYYADKAAGR